MQQAFAVFTAFLVVALPLAVGVTKVVDTVRNLFGSSEPKVPKVAWNILALVLGVITALCFGINLLSPIAAAFPGIKDWAPSDSWAEVLSGIAIGAMAGFWHEKMDQWSSLAKAARPR